jgi:hypothetical protein
MFLNGQNFNTDESKVPDFELPDLQETSEGKKITTAEEWETIQRPEILKLFETQVYGKAPQEEIMVETEEKTLDIAFQNKATIREITFIWTNKGRSNKAVLLLILPNVRSPSPVFLGYNFNGNHTVLPTATIDLPETWVLNSAEIGVMDHRATAVSRGSKYSRWPLLNILNRGYGIATMYYGDIDPDFDDGFRNGVHALFSNSDSLKADEWGSVATWSWGLSRIMDYLETDGAIDPTRVAVIGHSRLGKAALWAGARDGRFAMVISNNSGCGGAALSKRKFGETVAAINTQFPHWFCGNFKQYNDKEEIMPFDQHQLLALMAPRPLYVASAENDSWADPSGEYLALKSSGAIYGLYDQGSVLKAQQPEVNRPVREGKIGYHIRSGGHDITPYDWEQFLNFADTHFR